MLRHQDQATRGLVQPVNDPRPQLAAYARERIAIPVKKRIHQRASAACLVRGPAARVYGHARRLIDRGKVVVLIHNRQRYIFSRGVQRRWLRLADHDDGLARLYAVTGLLRAAVYRHMDVLDQQLQPL